MILRKVSLYDLVEIRDVLKETSELEEDIRQLWDRLTLDICYDKDYCRLPGVDYRKLPEEDVKKIRVCALYLAKLYLAEKVAEEEAKKESDGLLFLSPAVASSET